MSDEIFNRAADLDSPAWTGAAVVPSDSVGITRAPTRGLWVGVGGDISVLMAGGGSVVLKGVQGLIPIRVDRVNLTGTTATDIVALY
jgi:hypothetical protein